MRFIILSGEQAQQACQNPDSPNAVLMPRAIKVGLFILPLAVLDDPAHLERREFLSSLPQRDVGVEEFPTEDTV